MFHRNNRTRQIITAVIILILVLAMVLPMIASFIV